MFLHMSVILSTGRTGVGFPACITCHMTRGWGVCIQGEGGLHPKGEGGLHPGGRQTGTGKVGGTHPTGMLPC